MGVGRQVLRLDDRLEKVVGQVRLAHRDRVEGGACAAGHLAGDRSLVILGPVETDGERPDRFGTVDRGQSQDGR